jgi:Beta-ketoacyl synthase, N-terminal domain
MFYIHKTFCISPQQTFQQGDMKMLFEPVDKKLHAIEPTYEGIPPGILRRMGKAIRIGVGAALPLLKDAGPLNGIIIGTANGGMEDCIKFLNQMVQYEEDMLAPGSFVQSTSNVIAAQLGLMTANKGYNITHAHLGLSFENAAIDAAMHLNEQPGSSFLLGGVDEISGYNYNIENLAGSYKEAEISVSQLYENDSPGSIAGEGAAMFIVNNNKPGAIAKIAGIATIHSKDISIVKQQLKKFLEKNAGSQPINLLLTGENGDNRTLPFYTACEEIVGDSAAVARFKHMTGEYPTASAIAVWLACQVLQIQQVPAHMQKRNSGNSYRNILIYNNYKGLQHSFILVSEPV